MEPIRLTKKTFEQIPNGMIFRTVTNMLHEVRHPDGSMIPATIRYVCVKGKIGIDWAIYGHHENLDPDFIRLMGEKETWQAMIQNICPCDPDVLALYRR